MNIPFRFISFLIFLIIAGCGHAQENTSKKKNPTHAEQKITVKLCGDNPDEIWLNITKSKTETSPSLLQLDQKTPDRQFFADTQVQADAGLLGVYSNSYKFLPGDSVCIAFVKSPKNKYKLPFLTVTNRDFNTKELNFYFYLNNNIPGINNYDFSPIKEKGTARQSLLASKGYLDSLYHKSLVSTSFATQTAIEMDYMYYNALLSEYRKGKTEVSKDIPIAAYNNDSLIENWVYRGFLIKYLEVLIMKSKTWGDVDYTAAYSKIPTVFKGKTKEYLMYYVLNKSNTKNAAKFNMLLSDFRLKVQDKEYQEAISKNYSVQKANKLPGETVLETYNQNARDYKAFISSLKGKVIYIDLWASWCSPCRSSMGDSRYLRKKYSGKDISFVYISIDEKRTAWEEASKEELLSEYTYSFLLKNVKESGLLKTLGVKTIPRYVIYDKAGKMVDADAPDPGSKGLEKILNKYLID